MKLSLEKRPCQMGGSMSTNTEHHGDDDVGAIDIRLDGIMLGRSDLDALLGDGAHAALYVTAASNGEEAMPDLRLPQLKPLVLKDHFEGARVVLRPGFAGDEWLVFADCKVRQVKLELQSGGLTKLSCSVRARPDPEDVGTLFEWQNTEVMVEISDGKRAQPKAKDRQGDLALGEPPDPDAENLQETQEA